MTFEVIFKILIASALALLLFDIGCVLVGKILPPRWWRIWYAVALFSLVLLSVTNLGL